MKIVNAGYEILPHAEYPLDTIKKIERVARVCYKSEDKITYTSYENMIKSLVKRKHYAMLEHGSVILELTEEAYTELWNKIRVLTVVYGERVFLRYTSISYSGRYIVSGNLRAWLEYFELIVKHGLLLNSAIFSIFKALEYSIIFDNVLIEEERRIFVGGARGIFYKDLSYSEKLIHGDLSVKFTVDRGVSHEIVRHRVGSFAQESTRYCNYGNKDGGITVIKPNYLAEGTSMYAFWKNACASAEVYYLSMLAGGATPQEARAVLPNSLKTEIVMTANLKEWVHFLALRAKGVTGAPHPQMLEVAKPLMEDLEAMEPVIADALKRV